MALSQVANAFVAISPSFKGFREAVEGESATAGVSGAGRFKEKFASGGPSAGSALGKGVKGGFDEAAGDLGKSALAGLQKEVASASSAYGKASAARADAAGKVRVAEAQLAEALEKHGAGSARVIAAEEKLASAQRTSASVADNYRAAGERVREAKEKLAAAEKSASDATEKSASAATSSASKFSQLRGDVAGAASGFEELEGEAKGADAALSNFTGFAAIAAGAVAVGAAFASGVSSAIEQADLGGTLRAQLGDTQAAADAAEIASAVYRSGWGESLAEVGESAAVVQSQIGSLGKDADLGGITTQAIALADVFGQDVTGMASAAAQMIKTGLADSGQEAFDILTRGFQTTHGMSDDLLDTFTEYSGLLSGIGLDGETAMGLLSQGLGAGARNADLVADAFKEFGIIAKEGGEEAIAAFDSIGINGADAVAAVAAGGEGAAQVLQRTLDGLRAIEDPIERNAVAVQLFGTMAEDLGSALYALDPSTAAAGLGELAGAAESATRDAEGMSQAWDSIVRTITGQLGEALMPAVSEFSGWVGGALDGLIDLLADGDFTSAFAEAFGVEEDAPIVDLIFNVRDAAEGLVSWWSDTGAPALQAGFDVALTVLGGLVGFAAENAEWLAPLTLGVIAFVGAYQAVSAVQGVLAAVKLATEGQTVAQWALNAAMTANPVGLVIAAITALVAALVWFFTQTELGKEIWAGFVGWLQDVIAGFGDWWSSFWPPIGEFFAAVWNGIVSVVQLGWQGMMIVFAAIGEFISGTLGPIFTWLYESIAKPVFEGIGFVIAAAWAAIQIIFAAIVWVLENTLGPVFRWLYENVVKPGFEGIQIVIGAVSDWFQSSIVPLFKIGLETLGTIFTWLYENAVKPGFEGMQIVIGAVGDWFQGTLVPIFDKAIAVIGDAFGRFGSTVADVWESIRTAAMVPVRFIVETIYRDGIMAMFNTIAEKVGSEIRMPAPPALSFATGGTLPGWSPGRDIYDFISPNGGGRLRLGGGESIMVQEFTAAAGGPAGIAALNRAAKAGELSFAGGGVFSQDDVDWLSRVGIAMSQDHAAGGVVSFANGGVWDAVSGAVSSAVSWVQDIGAAIADVLSNPSGVIDTVVRQPLKAMLGGVGGGAFGEMLSAVPLGWVDAFEEKILAFIATLTPSAGTWDGGTVSYGGYSGGETLARLIPLIRASGVSITDTYRTKQENDALGSGEYSYHRDPNNPAVDLAGSSGQMWSVYDMVMANGPWRQVLWQVAGHYDHVHVANQGGVWPELPTRLYDRGGVLEPGVTLAANLSGKPEAILTSEQWGLLASAANVAGVSPEALAAAVMAALDGLGLTLDVDGNAFSAYLRSVARSEAVADRREAGRRAVAW